MVVGICQIDLIIHNNHSLKGKRQVLKAIIERVKNRFNVSAAEVGDNDVWQRSQIGLCVVGNDSSHINGILDKTINFIESLHLAEIIDHRIEIVNY
ncbi:MAG: cytoplasmic protein [Deltaproteobacteria bacterium GWC2_42_51]|nr:MAG: cytoplasmic protein [Deltaproteobacteria bacterium GWA2_42_85]OGP32875.1 MAG: cytoplasmic protein [Deltaproteobacteria bacterium GWC2_42_51]OGP40735.1 MAG: cytoplasmic protein [Deltaproteobacteria bacterium GWD2_42_10]OGP47282.1 MAG: cytoplasmic protein [Deltaproteobacteria bacterium GWF2_42_12]OGQ25173.1 MAG: cytoplasmic protein [Deltaproteobacteria bacterium RIFCSPHIGHO2_02_FULL_42_44]OGQ36188.1 MAG: cytoplasmic protein [Deltaproteobacteria bacterium RIFCSPLOWO2_02_FULL_42_39]OGQ688